MSMCVRYISVIDRKYRYWVSIIGRRKKCLTFTDYFLTTVSSHKILGVKHPWYMKFGVDFEWFFFFFWIPYVLRLRLSHNYVIISHFVTLFIPWLNLISKIQTTQKIPKNCSIMSMKVAHHIYFCLFIEIFLNQNILTFQ